MSQHNYFFRLELFRKTLNDYYPKFADVFHAFTFCKVLLTDEFESTEMKVLVLLIGAMLITVIWIPGWFYIMLFVVCSFRILDDLVDIFKEKK